MVWLHSLQTLMHNWNQLVCFTLLSEVCVLPERSRGVYMGLWRRRDKIVSYPGSLTGQILFHVLQCCLLRIWNWQDWSDKPNMKHHYSSGLCASLEGSPVWRNQIIGLISKWNILLTVVYLPIYQATQIWRRISPMRSSARVVVIIVSQNESNNRTCNAPKMGQERMKVSEKSGKVGMKIQNVWTQIFSAPYKHIGGICYYAQQ